MFSFPREHKKQPRVDRVEQKILTVGSETASPDPDPEADFVCFVLNFFFKWRVLAVCRHRREKERNTCLVYHSRNPTFPKRSSKKEKENKKKMTKKGKKKKKRREKGKEYDEDESRRRDKTRHVYKTSPDFVLHHS